MVEAYYSSNGIEIPSDLDEIIEDQICQRQPESKCKYSGLGDRIAQGIHILAGAVDAVAGTELKKKAKRCSTCGSRRQKLNKISS